MPSLPRTSIPASPCPPAFLPIGTRVLPCAAALDSRRLCDCDGWGELVLSIPSERTRSIVVTELIQLRFDFTRLRALPRNTLTSSYYFRHSNKHAQTKPDFSGSQVQRYSLRLVFLPHIRFTAKSAAPVGSSCQSRLCSSARRIPQNRAVLASAPLGSAPLRRLTAPPCAPSLANYETNVFYWPARPNSSWMFVQGLELSRIRPGKGLGTVFSGQRNSSG
jgi:hypothetical protein